MSEPLEETGEVQERMRVAQAAQSQKVEPKAADPLSGLSGSTVEDLEEAIRRVLAAQAKPKSTKRAEPDWASLSEEDAFKPGAYIPVIPHDIPEYLSMKLADTEYVCVWANRDQRRIGQLQAEGYEVLRPEHVARDFKTPLLFDSEKNYIYQDVIAMRVHKRIRFGKLRRIQEISQAQLKPLVAQARAREELEAKAIALDPALGEAFSEGSLGFYSTES